MENISIINTKLIGCNLIADNSDSETITNINKL
jgi:hypothetical protein